MSEHAGMKKAKVHLELHMERKVKENKEGFYKYIREERKANENVRLLLNGAGHMVIQQKKKAEVLNAFFASVFTSKTGLQESQGLGRKAGARKIRPL